MMVMWDPVRKLWIVDEKEEQEQRERERFMERFLEMQTEMEKARHRAEVCHAVLHGNQQDGSYAPAVPEEDLQ